MRLIENVVFCFGINLNFIITFKKKYTKVVSFGSLQGKLNIHFYYCYYSTRLNKKDKLKALKKNLKFHHLA
jgi:hypothetical protein